MSQYWHVFINQIHPIWPESSKLIMAIVGNCAFMEITKVKWCHTDRALIRLVSTLQEEERPECSCALCTYAKERPCEKTVSKRVLNRRKEPGGNVSADKSERSFLWRWRKGPQVEGMWPAHASPKRQRNGFSGRDCRREHRTTDTWFLV